MPINMETQINNYFIIHLHNSLFFFYIIFAVGIPQCFVSLWKTLNRSVVFDVYISIGGRAYQSDVFMPPHLCRSLKKPTHLIITISLNITFRRRWRCFSYLRFPLQSLPACLRDVAQVRVSEFRVPSRQMINFN